MIRRRVVVPRRHFLVRHPVHAVHGVPRRQARRQIQKRIRHDGIFRKHPFARVDNQRAGKIAQNDGDGHLLQARHIILAMQSPRHIIAHPRIPHAHDGSGAEKAQEHAQKQSPSGRFRRFEEHERRHQQKKREIARAEKQRQNFALSVFFNHERDGRLRDVRQKRHRRQQTDDQVVRAQHQSVGGQERTRRPRLDDLRIASLAHGVGHFVADNRHGDFLLRRHGVVPRVAAFLRIRAERSRYFLKKSPQRQPPRRTVRRIRSRPRRLFSPADRKSTPPRRQRPAPAPEYPRPTTRRPKPLRQFPRKRPE